jgi:ribosomal-protein-alanine N-acetyltransferase
MRLPVSPEIAPLLAGDLEELAALEADLQPFPWSRGNFADSLAAGHDLWACRLGGRLIGFAVVMRALDEGHLLNIGVSRPYQGAGHGAQLMQQVMRSCAVSGVRRILLEVRASNRQAIDFYRRFGFASIGLRRGYYPAAVGREDAIVLARELAWD